MPKLRHILLVAAALVAAALLLPGSLGGRTELVRSYGVSMEPTVHAGDIAMVRAAASYEIGDIVAYHSPQLGRIVLHRIVDRDGDAFVFQGDNNDFRDPEHLGTGAILGRLVVRVPGGGRVFEWLASPLHAASVAVIASLLPAVFPRRRRPRPTQPKPTGEEPMKASLISGAQTIVPWLAAAGTALLVVGGIAVSRPATHDVDERVALTQEASFTYAPSTTAATVVEHRAGDPVFARLADRVDVRVAHRVVTEAATSLAGTVSVDAHLSGSDGWRRTVPLLRPRPLDLDTTTVDVTLDLPALRAVAAETAALVGTSTAELRIVVAPTIDLAGTVAGQPVDATFEPELAFVLDAIALRLAAPAADEATGLTQAQEATVTRSMRAATTFPLPLGPELPVSQVRAIGIALGGLLLALAGGLLLAGRAAGGGEADRIAGRYGRLLVPISATAAEAQRTVVDVGTIDDLVRVAKHHERLVHHQVADGAHTYLVEVQGTAYRYEAAPTLVASDA